MPRIIKDGGIVEDAALVLGIEDVDGLADDAGRRYFLPLSYWLDRYADRNDGSEYPHVWVGSHDPIESLTPHLSKIAAIAVYFERFSDGTGFSTAAHLREVFGYKGELRAFGHILADQVIPLRRCGFNAMALPEGESLETALSLLLTAGLTYQGSIFSPRTPFKFRFQEAGLND